MATRNRPRQAGATRPRASRRASPNKPKEIVLPPRNDFPVVGLGASAGGLEAVGKLLDALPADGGMAFILVQHLDPTHESMMVDLLRGHTAMTVVQAADAMLVERNHVYVIPPQSDLSIRKGALHLSPPRERRGARMPFDFFLRSLAEECGRLAVCVVLSGTGADGTVGLKAIKEKGGLIVVQDPAEAAFDGMPRSAISTGAADLVLTVSEIPEALAARGRQLQLKAGTKGSVPPDQASDALAQIIDLLSAQSPHKFGFYKPSTLLRRLERRMALTATADTERYLDLLRSDPRERELLAKDLLIHVTSFFRDPKAFELLAEKVAPDLVRHRAPDRTLRVWVPACSTGEEAYSIAMVLLDEIATAKQGIRLQVFASDIEADAVTFARNGLYPDSIQAEMTPQRLARFFVKEGESYRVAPALRESVVFTLQDVLADVPFSRLDLVSCRNLLIYLRPEVQEKVLSLFHFALREGGVLFLGTAETVGSHTDWFEPFSEEHRIYRHAERSRPGEVDFPIVGGESRRPVWPRIVRAPALQQGGSEEIAQRLLLETYAPASVLINRKHEGLFFFGPTDRYLRVAAGAASRDLVAMAREGLRNKLMLAIQQTKRTHEHTTSTDAQVDRDGQSVTVSIDVRPVQNDGEDLLLVSFTDQPRTTKQPRAAAEPATDGSRIAELEQELDATRKDLQAAIRNLEISNEEFQEINEEAMSVNEEYQSTNEELETSKEELQSLNEELTALNSQLQETIGQLRGTSNDLQNILNSADVATIFLDSKLHIRFFTPAAKVALQHDRLGYRPSPRRSRATLQ